MLVVCPECQLQVSDKARICPHCGYPLKEDVIVKPVRRSSKRMRLPNGFGQITEIKGRNLRRPFRVMVPVGKTETGRVISKLLTPKAYFSTYNEAYAALVEYNKDPHKIDRKITLVMLYAEWLPRYSAGVKIETVRNTEAVWAHMTPLYDCDILTLRAKQLREFIEQAGSSEDDEPEISALTRQKMKFLLNMLYDYAVECEYIPHNYARDFTLGKAISEEASTTKNPHIPFTDIEISALFIKAETDDIAAMVLIQCYMGWRPQELAILPKEDVNINEWSIVGGLKTSAGKRRKVPIHPRIRHLVARFYNSPDPKWMFSNLKYPGKSMTYKQYQYHFDKLVEEMHLNPEHRPHDPRKHFATLAKKCGVDEYVIKIIMGHTIDDVTERVYVDRDFNWLMQEIKKIK